MIETSVIALHFCQYICTCSIEILVEKYLHCTKVLYFIRTQLRHNSLRRKCLVQKLIEIIFQSEKVISPAYLKTDILTSIHFFLSKNTWFFHLNGLRKCFAIWSLTDGPNCFYLCIHLLQSNLYLHVNKGFVSFTVHNKSIFFLFTQI